jgi:hypothetical protein
MESMTDVSSSSIPSRRLPLQGRFLLGLGLFGLAACSSSSDVVNEATQSGGTQFELLSFAASAQDVALSNGAVWQINRPISMRFSQPVDFSTINTSSIRITKSTGEQAVGEFRLKKDSNGLETIVTFQPRCPTQTDLSDAGLDFGGVPYTIQVVGKDVPGGIAVTSKGGLSLGTSQTRTFFTPGTPSDTIETLAPSELYFDTKSGAPGLLFENSLATLGASSYVESFAPDPVTGELMETRTYFDQGDLVEGVPINLYSDASQQVAFVLEFDQPVNPSEVNLSSDGVSLEYYAGDLSAGEVTSNWTPVETTVTLDRNCTLTGARLRVAPNGILPPSASLRIVVTTAFEDLIGQTSLLPVDGDVEFRTSDATTIIEGFNDGILADQLLESFNAPAGSSASLMQLVPDFSEPAAQIVGGRLRPSFDFLGTGGPNQSFDWRISQNTTIIGTNGLITGGPGFFPSAQQTISSGIINVRNMLLDEGVTLTFSGPLPIQIFATESVTINGRIEFNGPDSEDVIQLKSANLPQPGAIGVGGSGRGGFGSPVTTGSSAQGGTGFPPVGFLGSGGFGGETSFKSGTNWLVRRAGGGGGGSFADPALETAAILITERGMNGSPGAQGALSFATPPQGGDIGVGAFINESDDDNFWGIRELENGSQVVGELSDPIAGFGGGGGGDSIQEDTFPQVPWQLNEELRGAGGGAGGGQLQISAIGDITFGPDGQIFVDGGRGSRGESSIGINNIAGGSGGGSGGHVILQSANQVVFQTSGTGKNALRCRGGLGGPGEGPGQGQFSEGTGSGGDGGAGVIQVHVASADDVVFEGLADGKVLADVSAPDAFLCLPTFGRLSKARSKWLALGGAPVDATNDDLNPVLFNFDGIDSDDLLPDTSPNPDAGEILNTGGVINDLARILAGTPLEVDAVARTVRVDASPLLADASTPFSNDAYIRNPNLLRFALVELANGPATARIGVANAEYDAANQELLLSLDNTGGSLNNFVGGSTSYELIPRFIEVVTSGTSGLMPDAAAIRVRFQGARRNSLGMPEAVGDFTADVTTFNTGFLTGIDEVTGQPEIFELEFIRAEIEIDLVDANGGGNPVLDPLAPRPEIEFWRLPLVFGPGLN